MNTGRTSNEFNAEGTAKLIKKQRKHKIIIVLIFFALFIGAELFRSNFFIEVEEVTFASEQVPSGFDGVKIVQLSDYHNEGGGLEDRIVEKVKLESPDYIFLTGDIADKVVTHLDRAKSFLEKISKLGECYLVWGNHDMELKLSDREELESFCAEKGIRVLNNEYVTLERGGSKMLLVGTNNSFDSSPVERMFNKFPQGEKFVVWLHHYPEDFPDVIERSTKAGSPCDLLFAGHAHGGLIGLPFVGGMFAPGQGMFPEYIDGRYDKDGSVMYVSRGVGNSGYTLRFFDQFHIISCTLKSANK